MSDTFEERAREAAHQYVSSGGESFPDLAVAFVAGFIAGAADRERGLREPVACGHPRACRVVSSEGEFEDCHIVEYCSACRREQALREALRDLLDLPTAAHRARAEEILGGGK